MPTRIQRRRIPGWRAPLDSNGLPPIYVGRGRGRAGYWGNPFAVGELVVDTGWRVRPALPYEADEGPGTHTALDNHGRAFTYKVRAVRDRKEAVGLFRLHVQDRYDIWDPEEIRYKLAGRDLMCWCPLPEPGEPDYCHAAVLLEIANPAPAAPPVPARRPDIDHAALAAAGQLSLLPRAPYEGVPMYAATWPIRQEATR